MDVTSIKMSDPTEEELSTFSIISSKVLKESIISVDSEASKASVISKSSITTRFSVTSKISVASKISKSIKDSISRKASKLSKSIKAFVFFIKFKNFKGYEKKNELKFYEYGIKLDVNNYSMVVGIAGEQNKQIILLPEFESALPFIQYKLLVEVLSNKYKVITMEPFDYGLSDIIKGERMIDNIISSIEVLGFIGLDSFVPGAEETVEKIPEDTPNFISSYYVKLNSKWKKLHIEVCNKSMSNKVIEITGNHTNFVFDLTKKDEDKDED
ncbi:hypothetical protein PIROE2DRAFT_8136 [Piromyces sp. E2]|nr:hypothetical protein PIROE2DRAFT_8136 [Piromyces sp. E2]|eukprot:OUM64920.1 hypothetical protein PIROE2DRAFT_8136 [Piromyces sp. E2]